MIKIKDIDNLAVAVHDLPTGTLAFFARTTWMGRLSETGPAPIP